MESHQSPDPRDPPDPAVVQFENVGMRYGAGPEILRDVSFVLPPRSFHFLTGPSGAGKSSLMKLLYLDHQPSHGRIEVFGHDIAATPRGELPAIRRRIGVVFQDFRLIEHLSALENVALALIVAGARFEQVREHVAEMLRWVGLAEQIHAKPATLSGGEQQRVAIARAVIGKPRLLLADEPTGNVDDAVAMRILYLFEELNKIGTTVLVATHNDQLVTRFAHPRLDLQGGETTLLPPA
jgi:cell division transport system ATP-binding protein